MADAVKIFLWVAAFSLILGGGGALYYDSQLYERADTIWYFIWSGMIALGIIALCGGFLIRSDGRIMRAALRFIGRTGLSGLHVLVEREYVPERENETRLRLMKERQAEEEALKITPESSIEEKMAARKARVMRAKRQGKL